MQTETEKEAKPIRSDATGLTASRRVLMLLLNCLPVLHALAVVLVLAIDWGSIRWRCLVCLLVLYLLPPVAARVIQILAPIRQGHINLGSRDFAVWWALLNLQVLFSRLPALEEGLRLVPGLYSLWMRLWGARIGRLTYWAPGLRILDRSFVSLGDDVIFGAAVRINPHVLLRNEQGELALILATVNIGDRAVVGGYSLLTAGTEIPADECTRAFLVSPPFSKWKDGMRVSKHAP